MKKNTIRVASWNIWAFGKRDYKGIAKLIKDNKIDVIGIQEATIYYKKFVKDKTVESYQSSGPKIDMAKKIAKRLGYHFTFFPSFGNKTDYMAGNAIISRFPLHAIKCYKLNKASETAEGGTRILVTSKIKFDKRTINFLVTHLEVSLGFKSTKLRYAQVKKVISVINKLKGNVILTGDFNSVPENGELKMLGKKLRRVGNKKPTWPAIPFDYKNWHLRKPTYRVDNIYTSKNLTYKSFRILNCKLSDHLPIVADIPLNH